MNTKTSAALTVADLNVAYGEISAVRNATLHVEPGEAVAILGANGAGKSTLLNTIAGAVKPQSGVIEFDGQVLPHGKSEIVSRQGISLVPEGRQIFETLSVRENIEVGMRGIPRKLRDDRLDEVLSWFPVLREFISRPGGSLSGGQQQQLAIARALATNPRLILLDEPSLGLSPVMMDVVFEAIRKLSDEGVSLVLVEQNAGRALEVTNRVYGMLRGSIVFERPSAELSDQTELERLYLGME